MLELEASWKFALLEYGYLYAHMQQGYSLRKTQIALSLQDIFGELHEYYS